MAYAAFIVSAVAVLIAGGSLYVSLSQNSRDERRFQREEREARAQDEARLSAAFGAIDGGERGIAYHVTLTNYGKGFARHAGAWFADNDGNPKGIPDQRGLQLRPGEEVQVVVIAPTRQNYSGPLNLWMEWQDVNGHHEKQSAAAVPPAPITRL